MRFSRQEYWSGLPFSSPEDLPDPGIEPESPALQADTLPSEPIPAKMKKKKVEEIYNPELTRTKEVTNLEEPEVLSERKLQK